MGTEHDSGGDKHVAGDHDSSSDDDSDSDSDMESDSSSDSGSEHAGGEEDSKEEKLDEEDPVIKSIIAAKEKKSSNHPPDLLLEQIPSTLSFHPVEDLIVFGDYEGQLTLYGYSVESNQEVSKCQHANSSVRAITFSQGGDQLISAFSDQTLKFYDVENGLTVGRAIQTATPAPASSIYVIDENMIAVGDDNGNLLLWDTRSKEPTTTLHLGDDAITSMVSNAGRKVLVCTSEEGSIYAVKIRAGKVQVESEIYDYEFNCCCVFKQETKVAVGDGKGDVYIFNWDEFGKHSDMYSGIGRGEAINAIIPITERIMLCGGDDGFIRAYHCFPQKYLGVVGKVSYPVEKMDVCNDGHLIASLGADETIKFWNVSYFENMSIKTGPDASKMREKSGKVNKTTHKSSGERQDLNKHNLPSSSHQNSSDFFKGLAD